MFVTVLLFLCALSLSGIAAYYSIIGMAAIFASAFWPVVAMTGVLEISKLVVSSWLYQKWKIIPFLLKTYLTIAVIILMGITSLGIFGFLSRAHIDQNLNNIEVNLELEKIDSKITGIKSLTDRYENQLSLLDRALTIQLDAKRATQALANRKQQEKERDEIRKKLDDELKTIQDLQSKKTELKQKMSVIESKVGPIKYVAEFFSDGKDVDLDKSVRWMILIIVFVFDPLAVLMIIAANIGFRNWAENSKKKIIISKNQETIPPQRDPVEPKTQIPTIDFDPPIQKDEQQLIIEEPKIIIEKENVVVLTDSVPEPHAVNIENSEPNQQVQESITQNNTELNADVILEQIKEHHDKHNSQPEIPTREFRGYKY